MSVTIKPNKMKYKNSSGNYVGINAIAEQTTAEEIADIQAASTAAQGEITNLTNTKKTEITNKGNETLASIPQDYTSLSNQVNSLSSAKADKDGTHEDLTAGNALYLLSDRGDTDVAPYVFRKTGGAKNGYGREFLRKIVGGTVAWNQLINNGNFATKSLWQVSEGTYSVSNNVATITVGSGTLQFWKNIDVIEGHKYLATMSVKPQKNITAYLRFINVGSTYPFNANTWTTVNVIRVGAYTKSEEFNFYSAAPTETGDTIELRNFMLFDLTQMFGSTIADAIYAMEQATEGSGVAWFRSLFPKDYYAYDSGSLQSVQAKEHRTVGFNQWDEEWESGFFNTSTGAKINSATRIRCKNPIKVFPSTNYYIKNASGTNVYCFAYDAEMNLIDYWTRVDSQLVTPANCHYLNIATYDDYGVVYKNDICINISDLAKNGTYEPYAGYTYPLDSTLTLRGIPKWDSTNGLYYDGDEYKPDGSVKRKYGILDLGSVDWEQVNTFTENEYRQKTKYIVSDAKKASSGYVNANIICQKYDNIKAIETARTVIGIALDDEGFLRVFDPAYKDDGKSSAFKTAMSGVYLVYELETPTAEQADPFRELQISAHGGTEEFVDAGVTASTPTRDVSVPVGTETFYPVDIWHLIDELTALVLEN